MNTDGNQNQLNNENINDPMKHTNSDHFYPSVRLLQIKKNEINGSCGFDLSRSKWDPYPWVSSVDDTTPADITGLKVGDCVLEVNGEDILGLKISEIANLVKAKSDYVTLLLWSVGNDLSCDPDSICCGPMPLSLERLSACMQTILTTLECPVCLDLIPPPVIQCHNGHILCVRCRARSEKCPVCRERYSVVRSLIAEQIYNSILTAFKLNDDESHTTTQRHKMIKRNLREKLFGVKYKKRLPTGVATTSFEKDYNKNIDHKFNIGGNKINHCIVLKTQTNKFLNKLLGKAYSLDNITKNIPTTILNIDENDVSMSKGRRISLSTNDLTEHFMAIPRCPSANRLQYRQQNSDLPKMCYSNTLQIPSSSILNSLPLNKRPSSSLNVSSECINGAVYQEYQIDKSSVMKINSHHQLYKCHYCCIQSSKMFQAGTSLQNHVRSEHNIPIILFGSSSIEISLPLRDPIKNAAMILNLDNKQFWLELTIDKANDSISVKAFIEGTVDEGLKYMLETRLKNHVKNQLYEKELIMRSIVYSMTMETSTNFDDCRCNCLNGGCNNSSSSSSSSAITCCNHKNNNNKNNNDKINSSNDINNFIKHNNDSDTNNLFSIAGICEDDCKIDRNYVDDDDDAGGVLYNQNNIKAMFNKNSELLLKIDVKRRVAETMTK